MTSSRVVGRAALAFVFVGYGGCFADPLPVEIGSTEGSGDESGSGSSDAGTTGLPGSEDGEDTIAGSGGGSDDTGGCVVGDPGCLTPGATVWTVVLGGDDNDGAYAIAIDDDQIVVAGEEGTPGGSAPWLARLEADGATLWTHATAVGEGSNTLRDVVAVGGGDAAAVGSLAAGAQIQGLFEARDVTGASIVSTSYSGADIVALLGMTADDEGAIWAVGSASFGRSAPAEPLVLHYVPAAGGWSVDFSSVESGALGSFEGALFGIDHAPNGELVAVGHLRDGGPSDAAILRFSAGGELLDTPVTFGGPDADDFIGVAVDAEGRGVAVGRRGNGPTGSEILIVRFELGDVLAATSEHTWGDAPFTVANGFARDGDTIFIAAGTSADPSLTAASFDSAILRWDADESEPTWVVPLEADSPGRDFASDVALAPDGTLVACGVLTPVDGENGDAWIRKLAR
jgi:hypothetical protein